MSDVPLTAPLVSEKAVEMAISILVANGWFVYKIGNQVRAYAPTHNEYEDHDMNTMTLSVLIAKLQELQTQHGDIPVRVQTLSHVWDPEPVLKEHRRPGSVAERYILLNP